MKMNSFNTNVHDFRSSKRKCFSLTGWLMFVLLLSQTSCRPSETDNDNGSSSEPITYNDEDYMDADDIDWKDLADVEPRSKVHPIIFYKEDIVSEDYDPNKEKNKMTKQHHVKEIKPHQSQKYIEISRYHRLNNQTESNRNIKQEKVYFDINPIEYIDKEEARNYDDSSFNDNIHVEVISLLNEDNSNKKVPPAEDEFDSKHLLNKKQKKFHHRHRRDVTNELEGAISSINLRHKRNPFYQRNSHYANQLPNYRGVFFHPQLVIYPIKSSSVIKHPIKSPNYYNAYSPGGGYVFNRRPTSSTPIPIGVPDKIDDRFDEDRPVWPIETNTRKPVTEAPSKKTLPPRRPAPPILQFGDEDYVTSDTAENRSSRPSSPAVNSDRRSNSNPQTTTRPPPSRQSTTRPPVRSTPKPSRGISACIWAISSCCTGNEQIRYQCFERLGCSGAFWDLNPCADDIFRLAVKAADQYLE